MALAAIALGSNLSSPMGSRSANLQAAVERVTQLGQVRGVSSWLATEPVGYHDQPEFLNGALLLETDLSPLDLLDALLEIEQQLGRDRSHGIEKGPRSIDLDLLIYGDIVMQSPRLVLPHPEMHRRAFVLEPLAEIAPQMLHPATGFTISQLLKYLPGNVS